MTNIWPAGIQTEYICFKLQPDWMTETGMSMFLSASPVPVPQPHIHFDVPEISQWFHVKG